MKRDGFAGRLAYLRWLRGVGQVLAESDAALAERAGVGYGWLKKWMLRDDSPADRVLTAKLVAALGAEDESAWLLDGTGQPPQPSLWSDWVAGQIGSAKAPRPGKAVGTPAAKRKKA